jgi:hypothetical protein
MVNVIRLPKLSDVTRSFVNFKMMACGYGLTDDGKSNNIDVMIFDKQSISDSVASRYLMSTALAITSNVKCEAYYGYGTILSSNICTAADRNDAICNVIIFFLRTR